MKSQVLNGRRHSVIGCQPRAILGEYQGLVVTMIVNVTVIVTSNRIMSFERQEIFNYYYYTTFPIKREPRVESGHRVI